MNTNFWKNEKKTQRKCVSLLVFCLTICVCVESHASQCVYNRAVAIRINSYHVHITSYKWYLRLIAAHSQVQPLAFLSHNPSVCLSCSFALSPFHYVWINIHGVCLCMQRSLRSTNKNFKRKKAIKHTKTQSWTSARTHNHNRIGHTEVNIYIRWFQWDLLLLLFGGSKMHKQRIRMSV